MAFVAVAVAAAAAATPCTSVVARARARARARATAMSLAQSGTASRLAATLHGQKPLVDWQRARQARARRTPAAACPWSDPPRASARDSVAGSARHRGARVNHAYGGRRCGDDSGRCRRRRRWGTAGERDKARRGKAASHIIGALGECLQQTRLLLLQLLQPFASAEPGSLSRALARHRVDVVRVAGSDARSHLPTKWQRVRFAGGAGVPRGPHESGLQFAQYLQIASRLRLFEPQAG